MTTGIDLMVANHERLAKAASALYFAGVWVRQDSPSAEQDKKLWEELRDSLGLKPGASTGRAPG